MPTSLTDQMFEVKQKSLTDQIFDPSESKGSLTNQMFGPSIATPVAPEEPIELDIPSRFSDANIPIPVSLVDIKPTARFNIGDDIGTFSQDMSKVGSVIADTFKGISTMAMNPMETIKGGLDFALSLPGFMVGLGDAGISVAREGVSQLAYGTFNIEEMYNAASKGMQRSMEFFEPGKFILGKPTPESQLVAQVAMAPMSALSAIGQEVASRPMFEDSPNIRGLAKFAGDITGLMTMGLLLHGPRGKKFAKDTETIVKKAKDIIEKEKAVNEIPDVLIKEAQKKVLEAEKHQLELEAERVGKKISEDLLIREELTRQAEEIAKAKMLKPEKMREVKVDKRKKGFKDRVGPMVEDVPKTPYIELNPEFDKVMDGVIDVKLTKIPEKIIDLDQKTGTSIPSIEGEKSPFFQDIKTTEVFNNLYKERETAVNGDVELFTQKLINDVNRWYHGDKDVDIAKVRETLSNLASRGEELREDFISGADHFAWKETVSDAASWARRIDNKIIKRTELIEEGKVPKAEVDTTVDIDYFGENKPLPIKPSDKDGGSSGKGTKLYSGFDPTDATKAIIAGAKKVSEYTKRARGMKSFKPMQAARMLREEFNKAFIDRSGNIRIDLLNNLGEEGYKAIQKMYLAKGASSISANLLKQLQKEVYSGLNKSDKQILDTLILSDRMVDIGKYKSTTQFKFPDGLEPKNSVAYSELFGLIEKLTPEKGKLIRGRARAYYEWMKKPLKDMLDAELISQEEFTALSSHNYRRLKLVDVYDKRYGAKVGGKKRTVYDSGVESLAKGRDTDIFEPSSEIMALEVFNRAYGRILNNEANKSLLEIARRDKTNPFVRVKEEKSDIIPSGWSRVFMYEKGERKAIYLSPEMSKEWIVSSPETTYRYSQLMRYASGSPVLRTFATGINWSFALANLPRDVMHTWFTARTFKDGEWSGAYSPHAPVFAAQITSDLSRVFTDAATKGKRYNDYINEGGGMEFLVHQGRILQRGRHIEGPIDSIYNFLGYFGETSEIMTRLAIRDRVIRNRAKENGITYEQAYKNKDITREATFAARDYMDFGQGGGIAKALDNAIPYLNASIQGTRGMFRAFKPGSGTALSSTYKLAQFGALVSGLYIAMGKMHPESSKALKGNINTQNNLVIPIGDDFGFEDEKGQIRYPYLKIPLDPGQRFFKTLFEGSTDKWLGNEVDVDQLTDTLKQFSPVSEVSGVLPPTVSGALGYVTNKDFWLNEDIWRKTDKPFSFPQSKEEHIPGRTPQAYTDFGEVTGLSPERTRYAVEELTTNGTLWSYLLGQGYDAMRGLPKDKREQHLAMVLAKTPIIKRFFGVTNPYSKFAGKIESADEASDIKRWIQRRELDRLTEGYLFEKSVTRKEIFKNINSYKDLDTRDRLRDRFEFQEKTKTLPNRSFWLRLKGLSTDARAKVFVGRLKKSNAEEKSQLWKEYGKVSRIGGIASEGFRDEVKKLMVEKDD